MRLTLRQLQLFHAIAQTGSTTAASVRAALSQSAVSGALADLESALNVMLFDRAGKRLALNHNGRTLLPLARAILRDAQEIEQVFQSGASAPAPLRLAASSTIGSYVLPPLLASFQQQWPRARIDLRIGNTQSVVALAGALTVDLGLIEGPCRDAELAALPWIEDEMVIVAAPGYPLLAASGGRLGVRQLRQARWLLREPGSGTRETVEQALMPHLHHLAQASTLGSPEAIKNAAVAGMGLSCVSLFVVRDLLATGQLVQVPTTLPRLVRRFSLVHRNGILSGPLRAFALHCGIAAQALPKSTQAPQT
ncbi:MAG: LysR family transcriptional regulator [Burkholderiaceae bacterium]|jgi:DNA-binding transcriptional LysR family regulator|nr:LysR family transcriptional regulator [Burkholderiaceae bacterium]